jgi:predicted TIM-barrel fold metal-dependent hydrolase
MSATSHHDRSSNGAGPSVDRPVVVASCDSHVGPRLVPDLRAYCPASHRAQFDDFVERYDTSVTLFDGGLAHPNLSRPGHYEASARLADMDRDGVATEVLYHFSQNGQPFPFLMSPAGGLSNDADDRDLAAVGYHLYNRWLADFVSAEPDRLLGLAYLPLWDIGAARAELAWAADVGLKGVNFPPPGRPGVVPYNDRAWEPFWSACEDTGMTLHTHSGGGAPTEYAERPGGHQIQIYEGGGYMSRRAVWWLIHAGVFERHPLLRLVITEQYEGWWVPTFLELDNVYQRFGLSSAQGRLPRLPSEYAADHVLQGASFMSRWQAADALDHGYAANVAWGRDYPHVEGVFQVRDDEAAEPVTRLALRHLFSAVPPAETRAMAGENLARVMGLDLRRLERVAAAIGAPTLADLSAEPEALPEVDRGSNAFRGQAGPRVEAPIG